MTTEEELAALEVASAKVLRQSADGVSEENRSLSDLIALSKYRRSLQAQDAGGLGFTIRQIVAPGAVQ